MLMLFWRKLKRLLKMLRLMKMLICREGKQNPKQKIYKIDLDHANKVLSMQEDETKPAEVQEVVEVVTTAKIITEVVTAASETITAISTNISAAEAQVHADNVVKRYQAMKRKPQTEAQARKNMMVYLKNVAGFKMDYFKGIEDLEALWSLVKERFSTIKPKNFSDDFLLVTLRAMFEKPDIHAQIWKNQRSVHGPAKVKGWKMLESCGVQIITFTTTQLLLLVEKKYPLTRFTLDQMLNASSEGMYTAKKPLTFSRLAIMDPPGDTMAQITLPRSDQGTYVCNNQFAKVMLKFGVTHCLATSYHPQTSGQVKVSNRGLKHILERTVGENHASWSDKLDDALWAFRTAYKTPIGCTPYKLVYGNACHPPIELEHKAYWALKHANFDLQTTGDHKKVQLNELIELRDQAYENSLIYKEKTKSLHYSKIKDRVFNIGDRVLLFNSRLKNFSGKLKSAGLDHLPYLMFFRMALSSYPNQTGQISKLMVTD
nr:reverse transcriptase domain-containing protein [Tanacetum cinerariifolium]